MKIFKTLITTLVLTLMISSCSSLTDENDPGYDAAKIELSDATVKIDGNEVGNDPTSAVYTANDIVYYESGKDFTYGEGTEKDAHAKEDAAAHTVVHITKAGTYSVSGKLSHGQIAVDLGDGAKENPEAVVTLILSGVDITCDVAPAVIFYNVYECGSNDIEKASKDVNTESAGANVIISDGSVNTVNGSYVERIYKPETVVLNENKTEVEDADKLHKYDGAFYSKMSMNINGGKENTGVLNITASNEGLDSELHLTINGGNININSGNDGINTNEDGISVTTVNGGTVTINVNGKTGEGDGIDSNGWLVINGGKVTASACSDSADAGIDSDMGIHITGGTVIASGHMLDRIEDGGQTYSVFNFVEKQTAKSVLTLKNEDGESIVEYTPDNSYSILIYSSPDLVAGKYTLWNDGKQMEGQIGGTVGGPGRPEMKPDGIDLPEFSEDFEHPEGERPHDRPEPPDGEMPTTEQKPPEGSDFHEKPDRPIGDPDFGDMSVQDLTSEFKIIDGANMFNGIVYMD